MTLEHSRSRLALAMPKGAAAEIDEKARKFMKSLASKSVRFDPFRAARPQYLIFKVIRSDLPACSNE